MYIKAGCYGRPDSMNKTRNLPGNHKMLQTAQKLDKIHQNCLCWIFLTITEAGLDDKLFLNLIFRKAVLKTLKQKQKFGLKLPLNMS